MTHNLDSGLCMKGNGDAFFNAIRIAVSSCKDQFCYLEIGLGAGDTFRAARKAIGQLCFEYSLFGVDTAEFGKTNTAYELMGDEGWFHFEGSDSYFHKAKAPKNFIFIDGCHCYDCAKSDFIGAEKIIAPGGVIAMHDCGLREQGTEPQYGHGPIGVRKACEDLGLIPLIRPGWKLLEETYPYSQGGRPCLFIQKL